MVGAPAALVLFVALAMVVGSAQAAATSSSAHLTMVVGSAQAAARGCSPQFPLSCASYILDGRAVPLKTCCIEVQDNFQLVDPTASAQSYCDAINGVKLYNGPLGGTELTLALGLPQKCALSGQYKKGQKCNGAYSSTNSLDLIRNLDQSGRSSHHVAVIALSLCSLVGFAGTWALISN